MAIGTRAHRGALLSEGVSDSFAVLGTSRVAAVAMAQAMTHPASSAGHVGGVPAVAAVAPVSDAVLFAISAGDPNDDNTTTADDAILRVGIDNGATTGNALTRLFAGNPDFHNLRDLSLDVDHGYVFVVDDNFDATSRILRYDLTGLATGTLSTPTTVFATNTNGEAISSIEVDTSAQRIYWFDGDIFGADDGGYQLNSNNYAGTDYRTIKLVDFNLYNDPLFGPTGGIVDFAIDRARGYAYAVMAATGFSGSTLQNHVLRIDLSTGATTYLALGDTGGGQFHSGRLNPATYGQISAIDVDQSTGTVYFTTQALGQTDHGGVFSFAPGSTTGDMVAGTFATLWQQPADIAYSTPQTFPTSAIQGIEFDEVTGRYFLTAAADETGNNPSIFVGQGAGTPALFQQISAPTADGAPFGMEIDYAASVTATAGAAYVEQGAATNVFGSLTITDPDNTMLKGATVAITGGLLPGDQLIFANSGGITGSYNSGTGVLTLTGDATVASYQTFVQGITFSAAGDNPTNFGASPARTIGVTTFDGLVTSDPTSVTLAVTGVNDAPNVVVSGSASYVEQGLPANVFASVSIADPDSTTLTGATVTISSGFVASDQLNFVNASGVTGSYSAGVLTLTGTATLATYQTLLRSITFSNPGDDPTSGGSSPTRLIDLTVFDGLANSQATSASLGLLGVNDAPTATVTASNPTFLENGAAVSPFSNFAASTVEAGQSFTKLVLTVTNVESGHDGLTVGGQTLTLIDGATNTQSGITATVAITGTTATVTFTSAGIPAAVLAALIDNMGYTYAGDDPSSADRMITITSLQDDGGTINGGMDTTQLNLASTVHVTPVNDAPTTADGQATIDEDGSYTFTAADFPVTDAEGDQPKSVIFESVPSGGALVFDDGHGAVVIGPGALDYADATSGFLKFVPDANFNGQVTIVFRVQDDGGTASGGVDQSVAKTFTIDVSPVDDAPVAVANVAATFEDASVAIDVLGNDTDIDGGPKFVTKVNGTALAAAGDFAILASGAIVTLAADGSLVYDANGAFDELVSAATAAAARSSNAQAIDTFAYTLDGGSTATVSVTVNGVDGPDQQLLGSVGTDRIRLVGDPVVIDGGDGFDTLAITGGRTFTPADGVIRNFELILVDGGSTLDLGAVGGNVGPLVSRSEIGQSAHIVGTGDGDRIYGGAGGDELSGGGGNDTVFLTATPGLVSGGDGKDILVVRSGVHVTLTEATFGGFETVRIENGASADLSGVDSRIGFVRLASVAGGGSEVVGSAARDHIIGGDGDDVITGGLIGDLLTGGAGADTFVYTSFRDIGTSFREEITDFEHGRDTIDLSAIDPSRRLDGDQAFTFIGDRAFTGAGGTDFEIRYEAQGGGVLRLEFDVDHDGVVDYGMLVHATALQTSDFVL